MIVKNEAHGILKTLKSFKPYINCWSILDTGSTDGTPYIIKGFMEDCPGDLYEEPFIPYEDTGIIDYGATRNRCLELATNKAVFTLMIDSDEELSNGNLLQEFCQKNKDSLEPAYFVQRSESGLLYNSARLLRSTGSWRYSGPIHEVPTGPGNPPHSGITINYDMPSRSREATVARWNRDLSILKKMNSKNPDDVRTLFYLAQTLECLGNDNEAEKYYLECANKDWWKEEIYEARYRRARCFERLGKPWTEIQQLYLALCADFPHRAEPFYRLALHWHQEDKHELVCFFAQEGYKKDIPTGDILFIEREVYEWKLADLLSIHAFYVKGMKSLGYQAMKKVLKNYPGDKRHYEYNAAFYAENAKSLFPSYVSKPIENLIVEAPFYPSNPSIMIKNGNRHGIIRTVNYIIKDGLYYWPDGSDSIYTENIWVDFDNEWNITNQHKIKDVEGIVRTDYPCHGYEDCRIFTRGDVDYLSATVADFEKNPDGDGKREIVLIELDKNHDIFSVHPQHGQWSSRHQKNWMPLETDNLFPVWITSTEPFSTVGNPLDKGPEECGKYRGGSQAIRVRDGWLWLVHQVSFSDNIATRIYLHRFVYRKFTGEQLYSDPFFFEGRGIEFAAGLVLEEEKLVASFSVKDKSPHLGFFSLEEVLDSLSPSEDL